MKITVNCIQCGKQYSVGEELRGRQVKCNSCNTIFVVPAPQPMMPANVDPLADMSLDAAQQPLAPTNWPNAMSPAMQAKPQTTEREGPTDVQFRLGGGLMCFLGLVILAINHATFVFRREVYVIAVPLGSICAMLGLAGLIDPRILRSAGKYGKDLPKRFQAIAAVFALVAIVMMVVLAFFVYEVHHMEPARPGR